MQPQIAFSDEEVLRGVEDANQLHECLKKLSPVQRAECIETLVRSATSSQDRKELLFSLSGPVVTEFVEVMQKVGRFLMKPIQTIDVFFYDELLSDSKGCVKCMGLSDPRVHNIRRLLMGLARKTGTLPKTLFLQGIECKDRDPVGGGGFADIYLASYNGQPVALKRIRTFSMTSVDLEVLSVSIVVPIRRVYR